MIARTGYTGEDGFEIYVPADVATSERVWNAVMEAGKEFGIVPCGLGARNTLRLESKMALYEHEISDTINVWESGLERYCKMDKGDFLGRAGLEKAREAGLKRTLVGLEMVERGIARDGYRVVDESMEAIGVVTSGSPSPTSGQEYCAGVCAAGTVRDRDDRFTWKFAGRNARRRWWRLRFIKEYGRQQQSKLGPKDTRTIEEIPRCADSVRNDMVIGGALVGLISKDG